MIRLSHKLALLAMGALLAIAAPVRAQPAVTAESVGQSIDRAIANLRRSQRSDGSWSSSGYPGGATALATLAMLAAEVDPADPAVATALANLMRTDTNSTYVASLKCQAYAATLQAAGPDDSRAAALQGALADEVDYLTRAQNTTGLWSYRIGRRGGDNSNTQLALLGLHQARLAGARLSQPILARSETWFRRTQNRDGGWGYRKGSASYGSMTAAGVASLLICQQNLLDEKRKIFRDGAWPYCGTVGRDPAARAGLNWLAENFTVTTNPAKGSQWLYYYLYALERAGMIAGQQYIGQHDWYTAGATQLLSDQAPDGSWGGRVYNTAFGVLFLAKGNRPVLFQKLRWAGRWNRNPHDLENLTRFIGHRLGRRTTWQSLPADATAEQMRLAPVLYITGHEFPQLTDKQVAAIRRYVDELGGTLLLEACCGSNTFTTGAKQFLARAWPDEQLRILPADHAVFSTVFPLTDTNGLAGIDRGCRTGVFFSPRALSCLWEMQNLPDHSRRALQLGTNLAAYASGGEPLRKRLEAIELPAPAKPGQPEQEIPRGAIRLARLVHDGKYDTNSTAEHELARLLRDTAGVNVVTRSRHLDPTDEAIYQYPVLFLTGLRSFRYDKARLDALRTYLQRGGTLLINNGCGREQFRQAVLTMIGQLFPDRRLITLPKDHPIYTGQTGIKIGRVKYRPALARQLGADGTARPPIEAIFIDDRPAILYSRYDFACALEGVRPFASRGYLQDGGRRLAMALFLYAIGY
jgi:hypothetical protein